MDGRAGRGSSARRRPMTDLVCGHGRRVGGGLSCAATSASWGAYGRCATGTRRIAGGERRLIGRRRGRGCPACAPGSGAVRWRRRGRLGLPQGLFGGGGVGAGGGLAVAESEIVAAPRFDGAYSAVPAGGGGRLGGSGAEQGGEVAGRVVGSGADGVVDDEVDGVADQIATLSEAVLAVAGSAEALVEQVDLQRFLGVLSFQAADLVAQLGEVLAVGAAAVVALDGERLAGLGEAGAGLVIVCLSRREFSGCGGGVADRLPATSSERSGFSVHRSARSRRLRHWVSAVSRRRCTRSHSPAAVWGSARW